MPIVIVIDPGHGGENLGAQYDGYTEKEMTMIVARSMKEELEKYEDVVVYLTHDTDVDMSLKERAEFAADKNADFLFCLHFNSSVNHNLYGAEVWIPAYSDYYVKGRQYAEIQMQLFSSSGLYSRGIKTKLNDSNQDYYGILRHCSAKEVPAALIEHCHLDHANDKVFYQKSEEQLKEFGRIDAEAVAKYFGLSSKELGIDYSNYPKIVVEKPKEGVAIRPDKTEPDVCELEILSIDELTGKVIAKIEAYDLDSYIQYYCYSIDGGSTYSELLKWPRPYWNHSDTSYLSTIQIPYNKEIDLRIKAYNGFDGFKESNVVEIDALQKSENSSEKSEIVKYKEIPYSKFNKVETPQKNTDSFYIAATVILISFLMALVLVSMVRMIKKLKRSNKRKR